MKTKHTVLQALLTLTVILLALPPFLTAAIIIDPNGVGATDIDPADPGTWNSGTTSYIGKVASGELLVDNASIVECYRTYLGHESGSTGTITVDGSGSSWTTRNAFYVGEEGQGTLNITNGGTVHIRDSSYLGYGSDSTANVKVDGTSSKWTIESQLAVGYAGNGTLEIINGGEVKNENNGCIGYESGSIGTVTVNGNGSTWSNYRNLYVGRRGSGTLNIVNGSSVLVEQSLYLAYLEGSTGRINFVGANGGTLTTGSFVGSSSQLTGTGTINTCGLVSDVDLIFDATDDLTQTLYFNEPGQDITLNLDVSGTSEISGALGAGYLGNGSLAIQDGMTVASFSGYLGYCSGSTGTAIVDGTDSTWNDESGLNVGFFGNGTLEITNGGTVNSGAYSSYSYACLGYLAGATGTVKVEGIGSTWNHDNKLYVGLSSSGTMNITNGGTVSNSVGHVAYRVDSVGTVMVDGPGSTWINEKGFFVGYQGDGVVSVTNGGTLKTSSNLSQKECIRIGHEPSSTGTVTVSGAGSTWHSDADFGVGCGGNGTVNITNGGTLNASSNGTAIIVVGAWSGSYGTMTIDGIGSTCTTDGIWVGFGGSGSLNIVNGGVVKSLYGCLIAMRSYAGSDGAVTVDGIGSTWAIGHNLCVGDEGSGKLDITNGGLVSIAGTLTIDNDQNDDSFVKMGTGGMLALFGDANDSLGDFFELIEGTDAINYWDNSIEGWAPITEATLGTDYTLEYLSEGDLTGYTLLTVGTVPEPGCVILLVMLGWSIVYYRRPKK